MRTLDIMKLNKTILAALLVAGSITLSACGQRTEDATGSLSVQPTYNANGELTNGAGTPAVGAPNPDGLNLRILSDVNRINTGGTDMANIKALVTDANNNALAAADVNFRSTGGVLQNISRTTDDNGEATATLRLPQDFKNQDIIVTVSAGNDQADVKITALGSKLEVTGPDTLVLGDEAELVTRLVAGNGEPISNQLITVSSAAGNTIEPAVAVTDADGRVSIRVGTANADDTIRLTALSGTATVSHSFEVSEDVLRFSDSMRGAELPVAQENVVVVTWTSQGVPVVGRDLLFSTTAGEIVGSSTVPSSLVGQASIRIQSNSAGPAKISVESASDGKPKTSVDVEFVATEPSRIDIDASSARVHTKETSTLMALVSDVNGNPVKNQIVDFTSVDLKGGQLNPASAKTNSAGIASVTFTAGDNATELNDITVSSKLKGMAISDSMNLTVVKRVLNVTIGTSNEVIVKPLGTQYAMPFVVQVADGSGTPLENATVKLSIRPISYWKGRMVLVDKKGQAYAPDIENWTEHQWAPFVSVVCDSEDLNGNRMLDSDGVTTEDFNGNGSLDPQDPAALTAVEGVEYSTISGGSLSTDKNGSGFFEILYPASNAGWSYVEIMARAEALGAEAEDSFHSTLGIPAQVLLTTEADPPNKYSPYGEYPDCSNSY